MSAKAYVHAHDWDMSKPVKFKTPNGWVFKRLHCDHWGRSSYVNLPVSEFSWVKLKDVDIYDYY